MSLEKSRVIIIGAGIGGLSTAAYLSKLGVSSLLLEQTAHIGGRCSTRMINGLNYEIGALYIGGGVFENLRHIFGVECKSRPIRCGIKIGDHLASIPLSLRTFFELNRCGASWREIFRFLLRARILSNPLIFERTNSVGQIFDNLATDGVIRRFLDTLAGVSGVTPYRLPARYLRKDSPVTSYKMLNPEYLPAGNGELSNILYGLSKSRCKSIFNIRVNSILLEDNRAVGVRTSQGDYHCEAVVSNAGLRSTVLYLTSENSWPPEFYNTVAKSEESLSVVNIFLTFQRSFPIPEGFTIFFVPYDVNTDFASLERGYFPNYSMYILHVPTNIESKTTCDHRATLQFYYPKGEVSPHTLENQVNSIMHEGLDTLFKDFSKAITGYVVYDPKRYREEFGFSPHVFKMSPDFSYPIFPIQTQIPGLYCVGDSVAPEGPCVPQAMESGIACARLVADRLGVGEHIN